MSSNFIPTVLGGLDGKSILLIEDNEDWQRLCRYVLCSAGASIDIVASADEGIRLALAGAYDIILIDIRLPGKNGLVATEELRAQGYLGSIVALTGLAMVSDRLRGVAAGCDEYLTKPIGQGDLVNAVKMNCRAR
jgi:DNA-binding response OmpR family regulator